MNDEIAILKRRIELKEQLTKEAEKWNLENE